MSYSKIKVDKEHCINSEFLYYGKRLKACIKKYKYNHYTVECYTHNKEIVKQKQFFNFSLKENDYKELLELYQKAHEYAENYLYSCKY